MCQRHTQLLGRWISTEGTQPRLLKHTLLLRSGTAPEGCHSPWPHGWEELTPCRERQGLQRPPRHKPMSSSSSTLTRDPPEQPGGCKNSRTVVVEGLGWKDLRFYSGQILFLKKSHSSAALLQRSAHAANTSLESPGQTVVWERQAGFATAVDAEKWIESSSSLAQLGLLLVTSQQVRQIFLFSLFSLEDLLRKKTEKVLKYAKSRMNLFLLWHLGSCTDQYLQ